MEEVTFQVERDEESGALAAWWDDPRGGGITTQGDDLSDLQKQVTDAVSVHFDEDRAFTIRTALTDRVKVSLKV